MDNAIEKRENYLQVHNLTKRFGQFTALKDVSFSAKTGEFLSILGPSGCGKTTILRIVAGLETQTEGKVVVEGRDVSDLPVSKRNVGIVFQSYALFPNLSAADNVAYGLKNKSLPKREIKKRVIDLLKLVGLAGMEQKYPAKLSGGQQQRVALARAMALSPDLLLLDEPLSALDAKVRIRLRSEIRQLQRRLGVTTIMVTHDQEEALTMADQILVMNQGVLAQYGTPNEIYDHPASPFVASFIGSMNFIEEMTKSTDNLFRKGDLRLKASACSHISEGRRATVAIRPEDVVIGDNGGASSNRLKAAVRHMEYRGALYRMLLDLPVEGSTTMGVKVDVPIQKMRRFGLQEGMQIDIGFPEDRLLVYARQAS
ncbi:MAG: putative 2-aminoethylphosphonate ABC transporter ATP-binding protein [Desulfobacterales bacterium]|jgi:iron(III) transport system ATP-binding protein